VFAGLALSMALEPAAGMTWREAFRWGAAALLLGALGMAA